MNDSTKDIVCLMRTSNSVCNNRSCDRKFVYNLYMKIRGIVDYALRFIDYEYNRARSLKSHPHSVIYRIGMPISPNRLSDETRAYVEESRNDEKSSLPIRNFVIDRAVDIVKRIQNNKPRENIVIIDGVIEACLVYQISLNSLLSLRRYIDEQSMQFYEIHTRYDNLLKQYEDNKNDDMLPKIVEMQDSLDEQKTTIQRLINQVPFFVSRIREENDFTNLYANIDDTKMIHSFLTSDFVGNEIDRNGSTTLKNAYNNLKHNWQDLNASE